MKLIPVVEFEPGKFQSEEREGWQSYADDHPSGWNSYWGNSLADSGIIDLEPYESGSWLVETNKLTPEIVTILLKKIYEIDDESITDLEEMGIGTLSGGYVLEISDTVNITPSCCGGLENIKDWEEASDWMGKKTTDLWIGHPWLEVSSIDDRYLQISETSQYGESIGLLTVNVDRYELKAAIVDAKKQLEIFKQIIIITLPTIFPHILQNSSSPIANEIATILVYGW